MQEWGQPLYLALGLSWNHFVIPALHGTARPFSASSLARSPQMCQEPLSGWDALRCGWARRTIRLSALAREPRPPWSRCDDISMAKESPRGWTQRPVGGPGALGSDSGCATGKLTDTPQAPRVTGRRAPTVGLVWGMTGNVLKIAKPSAREGVCAQPPASLLDVLLTEGLSMTLATGGHTLLTTRKKSHGSLTPPEDSGLSPLHVAELG